MGPKKTTKRIWEEILTTSIIWETSSKIEEIRVILKNYTWCTRR